MRISVIDGDISTVSADALITAINSGGHVAGSVDNAIYRHNTYYHTELQEALEKRPLPQLATFVATAPKRTRLPFGDIVFVIDDVQCPVHETVFAGLIGAHHVKKKRVCMPLMRSGAALGRRETTLLQIANGYAAGIRRFRLEIEKPTIIDLTIVTYQDDETKALLRKKLLV